MPFVDTYLPEEVPGMPCLSVPRTRTSIAVNAGGREQRNQEWAHPLHRFVLPDATRRWAVVQALTKMWRILAGPFSSFAFRDPHDFASCDLAKPNFEPETSALDQPLGTGDGFTRQFALLKRYVFAGASYDRAIHLPVVGSVAIAIDGIVADPASYSVSRPGGIVDFAVAPPFGAAVTAGFLFDVEVRFEADDTLEQILRATHVAGFSDLTLIEVRPC